MGDTLAVLPPGHPPDLWSGERDLRTTPLLPTGVSLCAGSGRRTKDTHVRHDADTHRPINRAASPRRPDPFSADHQRTPSISITPIPLATLPTTSNTPRRT